MIEIDGSEGGGQLLRTSLGLSAITCKSFKMVNIRKKRPSKGIKEQHLQAINALAKLSNADVKGASLGSEEITFIPKKIKKGSLSVNISTAGSIGLVLQALLIPAVKEDILIKIKGGATYGKWAAPISFLQNILFPLLEKMNYKVKAEIEKEGFYPKGGALVKVHSYKANLKPIEIIEKGNLISIEGISVASNFLKKAEVAERQAKAARNLIFKKFEISPKIKIKYDESLCPGSGIILWAKTENSILGGGSLGELGKKAEIVGEEAAKDLIFEYENGAVDKYSADQLLPYIALAGYGKIKAAKITDHIITNSKVIEKFLDVKFEIKGNLIECRKV